LESIAWMFGPKLFDELVIFTQ